MYSRKATIIDVSGWIELREEDSLQWMKINKYGHFTITPNYCAPEINKDKNNKLNNTKKEYDPNLTINIEKSLSYTCGKILKDVFKI